MKLSKRRICINIFIALNVLFIIYTIACSAIYGFNVKKFITFGSSFVFLAVYLSFPILILGMWAAVMSIVWLLWCCFAYWFFTFLRAFIILWVPVESYRYMEKDLDNESLRNKIEKVFKCCYKNGPDDYTKKKLPIPETCYKIKHANDPNYLYKNGCAQELESSYRGPLVAWLEIILIILIIIANVLLIYYINQKRKKGRLQRMWQ